MPDGGTTIIIQGEKDSKLPEHSDDPYFKAAIKVLEERKDQGRQRFSAMVGNQKTWPADHQPVSQPSQRSRSSLKTSKPIVPDSFCSSNLNSDIKQKQQLLDTQNLKARAELLMNLMQTELQYAELKTKLTNKTRAELDKQQRDYFSNNNSRPSKMNWAEKIWRR